MEAHQSRDDQVQTPETTTMALTAGSPEAQTRALPSAWTSPDSGGPSFQDGLDALEFYKKKDPYKGVRLTPLSTNLY